MEKGLRKKHPGPFNFESDDENNLNGYELSDLSDFFEESDDDRRSDISGSLQSTPTQPQFLSLDDIPYDRDLKFINTPNGARPKASIGASNRFLKQVQSIATSNAGELRQLDQHYARMDSRKKDHDTKALYELNEQKQKPRRNGRSSRESRRSNRLNNEELHMRSEPNSYRRSQQIEPPNHQRGSHQPLTLHPQHPREDPRDRYFRSRGAPGNYQFDHYAPVNNFNPFAEVLQYYNEAEAEYRKNYSFDYRREFSPPPPGEPFQMNNLSESLGNLSSERPAKNTQLNPKNTQLNPKNTQLNPNAKMFIPSHVDWTMG